MPVIALLRKLNSFFQAKFIKSQFEISPILEWRFVHRKGWLPKSECQGSLFFVNIWYLIKYLYLYFNICVWLNIFLISWILFILAEENLYIGKGEFTGEHQGSLFSCLHILSIPKKQEIKAICTFCICWKNIRLYFRGIIVHQIK